VKPSNARDVGELFPSLGFIIKPSFLPTGFPFFVKAVATVVKASKGVV
jgi:hypothetical protein